MVPTPDDPATPEPAWLARLSPAAQRSIREGRSRLDPRRVGALVGIAGGLVFVLANLAWAPLPLAVVAGGLAIALAAATLWALLGRPRALGAPAALGVGAWWTYLGSVVGMLVVIAGARALLTSTGHAAAIPIAIAVAVGLHFLPFARAFRERHFVDLALVLVAIGVVGVLTAIVLGEPAGAASAVVAGIAMLGLMLAYAVRGRALSAR